MGLDLSIEFKIRDRRTGKVIHCTEIAYWRKAYGLRTYLVNLFRNSPYLIDSDDDFSFEASPEILTDIIRELSNKVNDIEDDCWTDSIWSPDSTRCQTLRQMSYIAGAEGWINNLEDKDLIDYYMDAEGNCAPIDSELFEEIINNIQDYEFRVELINSY